MLKMMLKPIKQTKGIMNQIIINAPVHLKN